jgi:dipeptidyl aminopeptidase/acylaminoacyl peptidase
VPKSFSVQNGMRALAELGFIVVQIDGMGTSNRSKAFHVAFSAAGCHDDRMDRMWWNEQRMGWPIGPQYAASSKTEHAARLQGKLLLVVGEYDTNVDPASTMQVVNALITANKTFDLLGIPNAGHTSGGPYGDRKRNACFVHHLLGVEPPDRIAVSDTR